MVSQVGLVSLAIQALVVFLAILASVALVDTQAGLVSRVTLAGLA